MAWIVTARYFKGKYICMYLIFLHTHTHTHTCMKQGIWTWWRINREKNNTKKCSRFPSLLVEHEPKYSHKIIYYEFECDCWWDIQLKMEWGTHLANKPIKNTKYSGSPSTRVNENSSVMPYSILNFCSPLIPASSLGKKTVLCGIGENLYWMQPFRKCDFHSFM